MARPYAFGLPKGMVPQPPKRPEPTTLRPDFNLKVSASQLLAIRAGSD